MPCSGRHDVAEEDRGIELEAPQRLQGHLGGQLGRAREVLEVDLGAQLPVLGQVAPGLAHHPDRACAAPAARRQAARKALPQAPRRGSSSFAQPPRHVRREVGDDQIGAGAMDAGQGLERRRALVDPAALAAAALMRLNSPDTW